MIRAIVTDIEGTTSSLSFVKDVLFPYARQHIGSFVRDHATQHDVAPLLGDVAALAGRPLSIADTVAQLERWIDEDRKVTPLKTLQGMLWARGYRDGAFQGHVYDDAVVALQAWRDAGIRLYVYSSGSVQAQKLLFAHTGRGDLTPLFSGYFDTHIGAKTEAESYHRIALAVGLPPVQLLFLSDIGPELDAARSAGLHTVWLVRGAVPDPSAVHRQVNSFAEVELQ
ncbi:MAG: acireductone synthase [Gammaproteobacteria bacterium]|nr:acireductone synthase [Gammaproteobacteria bacterium]